MTKHMSESRGRELLYARSGRICELCGMRRATNAHHRRAAGRHWDVWNLLDLCGSGTTGCHGFVTEHAKVARDFGWVVLSRHDPLWTPVVIWSRWRYLSRDGGYVRPRDGESGVPATFLIDGLLVRVPRRLGVTTGHADPG
jgi:hypothetical protein